MRAWTYSNLDKFETCPRQYYSVKVAREFADPPTVHSEWGERVHSAFEHRIKSGTELPEGMRQWTSIVDQIRARPGHKLTECKMAVTAGYAPASWDAAWSRGIIDVLIVGTKRAAVLDWKTGKRKPSEQLMLYAGFVFAHYPEVQEVDAAYVWLKDQKVDKSSYYRAELHNIWRPFVERASKLASAHERNAWPARPSGLCNGWCPVKSCEFNRSR